MPTNPADPYSELMQQRFVQTIYNEPRLALRYMGIVDRSLFTEPLAHGIWKQLEAGSPVRTLPFSVTPYHEHELEGVVNELIENAYVIKTLNWTDRLNRASVAKNIPLMEQIVMEIPYKHDTDLGRSPSAAVLELAEMMIRPEKNSMRIQSQELQVLDLVFAPSTILTIAGSSGTGKSALGEQIMLDLTQQGAFALDLTLELPTYYRSARYMQHIGGPDYSPIAFMDKTVNKGQFTSISDQYEFIGKRAGVLVPRNLRVHEDSESIFDVMGHITRFMLDYKFHQGECKKAGVEAGPPVVMVDFIQMVSAGRNLDNPNDAMIDVMKKLLHASKKQGFSLIIIAQFKKGVEEAIKLDPSYVPTNDAIEYGGPIVRYSHDVLLIRPMDKGNRKGINGRIYKKMALYKTKSRTQMLNSYEGYFDGDYLNHDYDKTSLARKF